MMLMILGEKGVFLLLVSIGVFFFFFFQIITLNSPFYTKFLCAYLDP